MNRFLLVLLACGLLMPSFAPRSLADEPPASTNSKIRLFKTDTKGMTEIIPGMVSLKHVYGKDVSVALFQVVPRKGEPIPIPSHTHGEEVAVVLKGKGVMRAAGQEIHFEPGDVMLIPAGVKHGGGNSGEVDGESLILSIITPPRTEMGPEGQTKSPYAGKDGGAASPRP